MMFDDETVNGDEEMPETESTPTTPEADTEGDDGATSGDDAAM